LVDTGSLFTWVPAAVLERLEISPARQIPFVLANGERLLRPTAEVLVEIDGVRQTTIVVFGQPGDMTLLGAYTLEAFLLAPDVVHKRMVPIIATVA
jgi:predicted aspartyl protease